MSKIPGAAMTRILHDINLNIPPEKSSLSYTPEMLAFREKCESEYHEHLKNNPDAEMEVPEDLPE